MLDTSLHCSVLKSVPRSHLLPPMLHNLPCVMAAMACVVLPCTCQLPFGCRGLMHSLFCPFGRHPCYKIPETSVPALRFGTCSKPLTCSSPPASAPPFELTCPSMPLCSQPTTLNQRSPCVAGSALPLDSLMTLLSVNLAAVLALPSSHSWTLSRAHLQPGFSRCVLLFLSSQSARLLSACYCTAGSDFLCRWPQPATVANARWMCWVIMSQLIPGPALYVSEVGRLNGSLRASAAKPQLLLQMCWSAT